VKLDQILAGLVEELPQVPSASPVGVSPNPSQTAIDQRDAEGQLWSCPLGTGVSGGLADDAPGSCLGDANQVR